MPGPSPIFLRSKEPNLIPKSLNTNPEIFRYEPMASPLPMCNSLCSLLHVFHADWSSVFIYNDTTIPGLFCSNNTPRLPNHQSLDEYDLLYKITFLQHDSNRVCMELMHGHHSWRKLDIQECSCCYRKAARKGRWEM